MASSKMCLLLHDVVDLTPIVKQETFKAQLFTLQGEKLCCLGQLTKVSACVQIPLG